MIEQPKKDESGSSGAVAPKRMRRCVTMDKHRSLVLKDPQYRWRRREIERETQDWIARYSRAGARTGLIRIPVVVHVIHRTAAENVSDEQILSQIRILNEDFRRLNADASSTPGVFAGVAADARLEFALAVRDPSCNATNGITRTATTRTGWVFSDEGMKSAATGGHDPWDVDRYLNLWVVHYTDGTLGYGTFPGMPANIQGVVCDYRAVGDIGAAAAPFGLGRTATHEIGHWLNLNHIWGDDGMACTASDNVGDTPNQGGYNVGAPAFPQISCGNGPNGDMFMNYMDYTEDAAMNMFTAGQVARMDAALSTARASILASDGLSVSSAAAPDLWMKDVSDDLGDEPDPSTQPMYVSDDIWVRKTNDGLLNQDHENPEYRDPTGPSNFVYVRIRNRACGGVATGRVKLYWAKASTGLSWPSPWDGSVATPALMGSEIGSQSVSVAGRDDEILVFPWAPPNPADYASFGADQGHFCLLARIETDTAAPYGMTFPETPNLYQNVQRNNNIVWKNITVVDEVPGAGRLASVLVANFTREAQKARLFFAAPKGRGPSIFDWGQVLVELPPKLAERRLEPPSEKDGIRAVDDRTHRVLRAGASLGTFELSPGEVHGVRVRLLPKHERPLGARVFTLDLVQEAHGKVVGGQRFLLKNPPDTRHLVPDTAPTVFDGVGWVTPPGGAPGGPCGCR